MDECACVFSSLILGGVGKGEGGGQVRSHPYYTNYQEAVPAKINKDINHHRMGVAIPSNQSSSSMDR